MSFYRYTIYGREVTLDEARAWLKAEGIEKQFDWNVWRTKTPSVEPPKIPSRRACRNCGAPARPVCDYCGS